ncbi:MAG TPA: anthranilate synthase component I [Fimbriiglobus sp.]|nr:anthranilate synthase component I [Fimbriiglobus sp.]
MPHRPSFDQFAELARTHTVVPVYRRLVADALTPVSAFWAIREPGGCFLFESVVGGERIGRYSFLGAGPFKTFEAYGNQVRRADGTEYTSADPLQDFETSLAEYQSPNLPELPRFCGGAVGYAGYDTVRYVERLPNAPPDDRHVPDLSFGFYDRMVIFDHITKVVFAVAHAHVGGDRGSGMGYRAAYDDACRRVDELVAKLTRPPTDLPLADIDPHTRHPIPDTRFQSNMPPGGYEAAVRKAVDYIHAGDAFQVVLSQRFRTETTARPFDIYRALRVINPSPFMFYLEAGDVTLVGASPEIMCRVEGREMTVRPLAGTRRRGATAEEDKALAAELLADPKERAEHIMLVDLARNDVGRAAELGSVKIADLMTVERYSHVMHISSTVTGTLLPGKTAFDAMRAALPAGTLSGAPKVRAMEIIDELEPHRRGPYGGAIGYVDFGGDTDTCIALRTMVIRGNVADVQAGAGIVADSDPTAEHQETVNKAMGLLRAIEVAETQL